MMPVEDGARLMPMNDLNVDFLKNGSTLIHYFGLGFIQIKMHELIRYHVYHEGLPMIVPEESIHNHRYRFVSMVRHGTIQQDIYQVEYRQPYSWEGFLDDADWEIRSVTCKDGEEAPDDREAVRVTHLISVCTSEGSSYQIDKDTFHRVKLLPESKSAITTVYRDPGTPWKKYAQVVTPSGEPPVCPFSHKIPEAELWEIVEDALR